MTEQKRRLPASIVVIALVAAVFGLGTAAIIVKSIPTQNNPVIVLPTANIRRLGMNAPAPDFTLKTFDGKAVSLKDLRGKTVLINFWASWCPPCRLETPDLVAAYQELGGSGVAFVGIGTQDDTDKLKQFVAENKVTYTILEDPKGAVSDAYNVLGLPTTVLIDSKGLVRKEFSGAVTKDQVIAEIKKLQ